MISHFKLILVPVDGSASAGRAAAFAADFALSTSLPLRLLHVYSPTGNEIVGMAQLSKERIQEISHQSGTAAFKKAREAMTAKDIEIDEVVTWGEPRTEIVAAADSADALIVMGRRGRGKLQGLLLGSVSEAVLRIATNPVTLVS
jgi:nucleotide-binding universal stress UspA family protein